jgi:hypothetical protein
VWYASGCRTISGSSFQASALCSNPTTHITLVQPPRVRAAASCSAICCHAQLLHNRNAHALSACGRMGATQTACSQHHCVSCLVICCYQPHGMHVQVANASQSSSNLHAPAYATNAAWYQHSNPCCSVSCQQASATNARKLQCFRAHEPPDISSPSRARRKCHTLTERTQPASAKLNWPAVP